jgi:putative salt-induced outer membrane protein YdiY
VRRAARRSIRGALPTIALVLVPVLAGPGAAVAQVNTERFRGGAGEDGVSGSVELSFANRTGNTDQLEVGAALRAGWRRGPRTALVIADLSVEKAGEETTINKGFTHLRGGRDLSPRLTWEGFLQHEYDRFAKLNARALVGTGPRLTLHRGEAVAAFLGLAWMVEWEWLDVPPGGPDPDRSRVHRLSTYLALEVDPTDRLALLNTVYVQPRPDEVSDTRVLDEAALKVGVAGPVSLKVSFSLRYDGEPPSGVKHVDTALTNRLVWDF